MLKNRFLVQTSLLFLLGIALGMLFPVSTTISAISIFIGGSSALVNIFFFKNKKINTKIFFIISLVIIFVCSFSYSSIICKKKYPDKFISNEEITVEAVILESNNKYIDIKVLEGDISKGTKIRIYNVKNNSYKQTISPFVKGEFKLYLSECPNYIKADGVSFYANGSVSDLRKYNGMYVRMAAHKTRSFFIEKINDTFSKSELSASFINAIILGDNSQLSDEVYSNYGRLGINHIIAVSGLHFTVVVMSLFGILTALGFYRKQRSVICIFFSVFYCLVSGSSPSSVRAMIMIILLFIGKIALYKMDALSSLSIAAIIIVSINPYSFYSTSFVLSFLATFAISISPQVLGDLNLYHKPKIVFFATGTIQSIYVTFMISMFIVPILYSRFQTFSIITPLANLIISFIFPILMYICLISVLISPFNIPDFIIEIVSFIIEKFHSVIEKMANIRGIAIAPPKSLIYIIIIAVIICVIIAFFVKKKQREITIKLLTAFFILSIILSIVLNNYVNKNYNQIFFSEDGDSALVIENGSKYYFVNNENKLNTNFLIDNGILDVDALIIYEISNEENAIKKLSSFTNQCKADEIYCNDEKLQSDKFNFISTDKFKFEGEINFKYGIYTLFKGTNNVLWLGDNAGKKSNTDNIKKLVLSESFFDKRTNVSYLPKQADEIYIPKIDETSYVMKYIKSNYQDSKIYTLNEFEHIIKNQ